MAPEAARRQVSHQGMYMFDSFVWYIYVWYMCLQFVHR